MPVTFSIRERLSSAFAVLCGRHGEVTHLAGAEKRCQEPLCRMGWRLRQRSAWSRHDGRPSRSVLSGTSRPNPLGPLETG